MAVYSTIGKKRMMKYDQQIGGVGLGQGMHADAGNEKTAVAEGGYHSTVNLGIAFAILACSV